ncbi:AAA family ATPase [Bacillus salipaludis]|uniref:AAA family ATPase n=1 Tax=Bacillus salipaludis TaxID=2547811 RepID=A0A4R5VXX6_9BACI|nr:sigma 54-interacting transcriptional regulator [Bacillus salipaludis]TDK64073.1 AAA family ATPase [Bacillus salipaludis]
MKLFVSGFSPLDQYVEEAIKIRKANFQELVVQRLESRDILKNPTYIQNDDVLICGSTIYEVFKKINVRGQLVPMRVQTSDFFKALNQAAMVGNEVNIINYKEVFLKNDTEELERIFNIKIHQYYYTDTEGTDVLIDELIEKNQSIVIGSGLIVSKAIKKGLKGFIWYGEESIKVAVDIAFNLLMARFEEQSSHKRQEYILDHFNEGVLSLNVTGRIIQVNPKAVELLGLQKYRDLRGVSIKEIDELDCIYEHLVNSDYSGGKLLEYENKNLYLQSFPIYVKDVNDGSLFIISDAVEIQKHEKKIRRKLYDDSNRAIYEFEDIIGKSEIIQKVKNKAKKIAKSDANVLIIGESGTGKELFAQSIHNASLRLNEPFIAVNCAAIPENLLESEFFGYSEGAFTGAIKGGKPGLFELAHKGTLFLDELGEIPLSMQSKLLRILQEKMVRRVGSAKSIPVDVRIIAATNVNLPEQVEQGKFRLDLFYRIGVLKLNLPTLNQRIEDLEDLVLSYTTRRHPNFVNVIERWNKEISQLLAKCQWKGNIRELENNLERFFAYLESPINITKRDVLTNLIESLEDNHFSFNNQVTENETYQTLIKEAEINTIKGVLQKTNGNKKDAAKLLGMSRSTLWRKLNEIN